MKAISWIGSSYRDLCEMPEEVRRCFGFALYLAQSGGKHPDAKPLRGFHGAGVLEVVEDHDGDTFRAVYTVRLADTVYVLQVFQKKSKRGIAIPAKDIETIKARLKIAEELHRKGKQP